MSVITQKFNALLSDQFDIRDVIARFEELEEQDERDEDESEEFKLIGDFLAEVKGAGGDEEWRGDWYPLTFVADWNFETYARDLAEDIGAIPDDVKWPCNCIDWEKAARELQIDYSLVEIDGDTYWYR